MYTVLIADDEPIERIVLSKMIRKYYEGQLEIVQAVNGREAIALFEENNCQIAVLDIEMPGINGLEAAEEIRKKDKDCSIIFLTAFEEFSYFIGNCDFWNGTETYVLRWRFRVTA